MLNTCVGEQKLPLVFLRR